MKPRVISLFSGVGTFDYGFHLAGWETVFLCEWDAKAREVLQARFPGVPISPDVCAVNGADLPDAEVVIFGSPCQDLSIAGKRAGLDGERSGLFMEAVRIIREKREATNGQFPRFALWENVPGAFSSPPSNKGADFAAVLSLLVGGTVYVPDGGWRNAGLAFGPLGQCAWRVLDSQFFGVPQRRRRIFALTDFGGERAGEVLLESEGVRGHPQAGRGAGQEVAGRPGIRPDRRSPGEGIAQTLTAAMLGSRFDAETETFIPVPLIAFDYKASVQRDPMCGPISPTLEAQDKTAITTRWGVRRLTPVEVERLQSMPDGWTDVNGMADTHRYRFMGNGGTANKLRWIAERLKGVL